MSACTPRSTPGRWACAVLAAAALAVPAARAMGAAAPRAHGSVRTTAAGLRYVLSFDVRTFTFVIVPPRGTRVTVYSTPRGFGCATDPDGAVRCAGRAAVAAGRVITGTVRLSRALGTRHLRVIGYARRGPIGPFTLRNAPG